MSLLVDIDSDDENCYGEKFFQGDLQKKKLKLSKKRKISNHNQLLKIEDFIGYKPSELEIKVMDGSIEIEGTICEEKDGFSSKKQLWRKLPLPKYLKNKDLDISFEENGALIIRKKLEKAIELKRQSKEIEKHQKMTKWG